MALREWVRLPTTWIRNGGLEEFRSTAAERSNNTAALMLLTALAHHADDENGIAKLTYDQLGMVTGLSRVTISGGLSALQRHGLIARKVEGRSTYHLSNYDPKRDWGKLPAKGLYASSGEIAAFRDFHLRRRVELDALKLYYLFVAFRNNASNLAHISYDKIHEYTDIERTNIKRGQSFLVAQGLVYVEHLPSEINQRGVTNLYRLVGLSPRQHMGTTGRALLSSGDFPE